MRSNFVGAFGVGLVLIVLAVAGVLFMQRGDAIGLDVKILKVRTAALDENSTIAVIDLRAMNPSNLLFEVSQVTMEMEDTSGKTYPGDVIGDSSAKQVFDALPVLGPKFLITLSVQQRIPAHVAQDYMVAARFQAPLARIDARKRFILHVDEVAGKSFEYAER